MQLRFQYALGLLLSTFALIALHDMSPPPAAARRGPVFTPLSLPPLKESAGPAQATPAYANAPTVTAIVPSAGPRHGWTQVEVAGTNFRKGLELRIGGKSALDVNVVSSSLIRARVPENTFIGSADVVVRNADGKAGGRLNGFTYYGAIYEIPGYNIPPDWSWVSDIKFADFNGDGRKDLLLAASWMPHEDTEFGHLRLYLQGPDRDGDGVPNFERVRHNPVLDDTTIHFSGLAVGDLDKDGDQDFVGTAFYYHFYATGEPQKNRVFLNDGKGNFRVVDLPGVAMSKGADIGDVNGDGNPDIVIANLPGQSQLLLGDGKGSFIDATATHFPKADLWTAHVHLVDVDRDRDLDAVLANTADPKKPHGSPNLLYVNDGQGHFRDMTAAMGFPAGNERSHRVDSADLDKDGDQDVAIASAGSSQILLNDGRGRFTPQPLPPYMAREFDPNMDFSKDIAYYVLFTDINVDGFPDLVFCANRASAMFFINVPGAGGRRAFEAKPDLVLPRPFGFGAESLDLADINGDGKPDLTIGPGNEQTPLWVNDWPKGFRFATANVKLNLPFTAWVSRSCDTGDLNGDGKPDIVMGQRHERELMLFFQTQQGWVRKDFVDESVIVRGKSVVETISIADLDGDGDQDVVIGMRGQPSHLLLNDGKGNLTTAKGEQALPRTPMGTSRALPVDVDLDGDLDLFMCNWERGLLAGGGQKNSLFINQGRGRFLDRSKEFLPNQGVSARGGDFGDLNKDGYPDLVLACLKPTLLAGGEPNRVYLNAGKAAPGKFQEAPLLPKNDFKSTSASLFDADGDGRLDILFTNEITLQSTQGEDNLYHQRPDGSFEDWSSRLPKINRITWEGQVLDFNQDGAQDLFTNRAYGNYEMGYGPKPEYGRLLLQVNDGKGNFSIPTVRQFDYVDQELDWWHGSCVDDLDRDDYPEIIECVDGQVRIHQTFLRTKAIAHPVYAEVAPGQEVRFDASSSRLAYGLTMKSVAWEFGDGGTQSGETVAHKYGRPGTYTVVLKVTDTAGRSDTDKVSVLVR
ncbi:MAG: FG-GAP-like repeat-containing protein [bacterium]